MEWFLWSCVVVVLGLAAVVGSGRLGGMPPVVRDAPVPALPPGELTGGDLRRVQFAVVTRGYSMPQVDDLLDRLAVQLDAVRAPDPRVAADPVSGSSAIMEPNEFSQPRREGEHGSNEAPHG